MPKKAVGEFRLIHYLSFSWGASVNDTIPEHLCLVKYVSFDHAVQVVCRCGIGVEIAKCNIKLAFRLPHVHPEDSELLFFAFE